MSYSLQNLCSFAECWSYFFLQKIASYTEDKDCLCLKMAHHNMKSTVDSCNRLNKASLAQDHVIMTAVCYMFVKLHHMKCLQKIWPKLQAWNTLLFLVLFFRKREKDRTIVYQIAGFCDAE